ncbi:hypothetical protein D3C87_823370 [compost metagenome]
MTAEVETTESPVDIARRWKLELDLAKRSDTKWINQGKKIVKRYRDDRAGTRGVGTRYNILWSNVQTILPAIYAKAPKAEAVRRNKDNDPAARCAAEIIERCLQYEIDHYPDFDEAMRNAVQDRLLPGRGVAWVRYEQKEIAVAEDVDPMQPQPPQVKDCAAVDYVYWEDFRNSPARVWGEVTWVARRVYMSRPEVKDRFGEFLEARGKRAADVPLTHVPIGLDQMKDQGATYGDTEAMKKAEVWELWDKKSKAVYWVAEGFDDLLDMVEDPYGLDEFWPCPKPLFATQTSDTLNPVPDFVLYQDQATELDMLTQRIGRLTEAVKVVGVYDASMTGVQRMLQEGIDNTLIPVDNWQAFSEKGGVKGTVDWLPLDQVIKALNECYMAREQCKQVIYEITGISDIIRGATEASETATAQNIKRQFGSLRLRPRQQDVAMFASEILRIKAQLMMDVYSPESLIAMSGIMDTYDREFVDQAIALMRQEPMRAYRVEVAADSLIEMDQEQEKASRTEFLGAASNFLRQAVPAAAQSPEMAPLLGEMLMFGVRAFKGGREMEAAFQKFVDQMSQPQPDKPDPEQMKIQADMQQREAEMQMNMQIEQAKLAAQTAAKRAELMAEMQVEQARMQMQAEVDINRQRAEAEQHAMKIRQEAELQALKDQLAQQQAMHDMAFARWKAELDAATKIEVANIGAKAKVDNEATQAATSEISAEVTQ